jgi:hypothetical protein
VRFSDAEMFLSGYMDTEHPIIQQFVSAVPDGEFPQRVVPITANSLVVVDDRNHEDLISTWVRDEVAEEKQDSFWKLAPVHSVFFSLPGDSCDFHYLALKLDTAAASFASFFTDSVNVDSIQKNTPKSVFACEPVCFASLFSFLYRNDVYNYMMQVKDYYVLADTSTTLEYYKKVVKKSNYIETGNQFRFASANTASDAVWSFTYFNQDDQLKKLMNKDYARKSKLNDLKVLSISHTVPSQRLVGSNIYLKF